MAFMETRLRSQDRLSMVVTLEEEISYRITQEKKTNKTTNGAIHIASYLNPRWDSLDRCVRPICVTILVAYRNMKSFNGINSRNLDKADSVDF